MSGGLERLTVLELDERGSFVGADGAPVGREAVRPFLERSLALRPGVTDVFVWVHGWRNHREQALAGASRLFGGVERLYAAQPERYPRIGAFSGQYVAVCWPSWSSVLPGGYARIRERAHAMTTSGYAEFALAHLLGYLDDQREPPKPAADVLRTRSGQYLHCVGHSFGGRFLSQAISQAASPRAPTLGPGQRHAYTVDSLLVFQVAAEPDIFGDRLLGLVGDAPLRSPICLTHSRHDHATCRWHRLAEGRPGIGCSGATGEPGQVAGTRLRPVAQDYTAADLGAPVVNVDASWRYRRGRFLPQGSHSDIWYDESYHLLLTLVNKARV